MTCDTFASRLVMSGVDLATLRELPGHKDIKMTLRYAHLSSEHKKQGVAALDKIRDRVTTIFTTSPNAVTQRKAESP